MRRELLDLEPGAVHNGRNGSLPPSGRRSDGKFSKGNACAVGHRSASAAWRDAAREAVTPERLRQIFAVAASKAVSQGDIAAARFVAEYVVGKPAQRLDLFRFDNEDAFPPDDPGLAYWE